MVNMAKMAWAFDITADPNKPPDQDIKTGFTDGFVFSAHPFTAQFTVRSPKHGEIIEREFEEAKAFFQKYDH